MGLFCVRTAWRAKELKPVLLLVTWVWLFVVWFWLFVACEFGYLWRVVLVICGVVLVILWCGVVWCGVM